MKCSWEDTFGSLLTKVGGHDMEDRTIMNIVIAKTEKFIDPTQVPPDAPITLCEQFNCYHVCLYVQSSSSMEASEPMSGRNAFDVLMAASHERVLPQAVEPTLGKELRSDQWLYNDVSGMFNIFTHTHTLTHSHKLSSLQCECMSIQVCWKQ